MRKEETVPSFKTQSSTTLPLPMISSFSASLELLFTEPEQIWKSSKWSKHGDMCELAPVSKVKRDVRTSSLVAICACSVFPDFFASLNFFSSEQSFQMCPFSLPGRCFLHQLQVLSFGWLEGVLEEVLEAFLLRFATAERAESVVIESEVSKASKCRLISV